MCRSACLLELEVHAHLRINADAASWVCLFAETGGHMVLQL